MQSNFTALIFSEVRSNLYYDFLSFPVGSCKKGRSGQRSNKDTLPMYCDTLCVRKC
jgi:hypothetical protein